MQLGQKGIFFIFKFKNLVKYGQFTSLDEKSLLYFFLQNLKEIVSDSLQHVFYESDDI